MRLDVILGIHGRWLTSVSRLLEADFEFCTVGVDGRVDPERGTIPRVVTGRERVTVYSFG